MKVTDDIVKYVANLAKLYINEEETKILTKDMSDIISFFEILDDTDTGNIRPKEHVIPLNNVLRKDKVVNSFERDKILENSPQKEDGLVKVPRIVE